MPHVTGHFCVCHVELWLLFHDFFPVPGCLFLDLDLGTWVPGYLGTWVPGYLGTWVPGYLGTWVPGYLGTWVPGYLGTWVPGYLGTWVPGYLGTWVPGYLGTWVPGYLGTWVPGHLGVPVGPQGPAVGLRGPTVSPTVGPLSPTVGLRGSDCRTPSDSDKRVRHFQDRLHRVIYKKKNILGTKLGQSRVLFLGSPSCILSQNGSKYGAWQGCRIADLCLEPNWIRKHIRTVNTIQ